MDDVALSIFRQRLKKRLRDRNRVAVSELCQLHKDAMRRYEKGEAEPRLSSLIEIARELDVSLDYLAGLSDNPKRME